MSLRAGVCPPESWNMSPFETKALYAFRETVNRLLTNLWASRMEITSMVTPIIASCTMHKMLDCTSNFTKCTKPRAGPGSRLTVSEAESARRKHLRHHQRKNTAYCRLQRVPGCLRTASRRFDTLRTFHRSPSPPPFFIYPLLLLLLASPYTD